MGMLRELSEYGAVYVRTATQMATHRVAREWMKLEMDVPAEEAAAWASLGYLPTEAAPLIAAGVTAALAGEMDEIANSAAGGPDERTAQVIGLLAADGVLVDPRRVQLVQDPTDPSHMIVHIDADGPR